MDAPERVPYDEPQTWYFTFGMGHRHAACYYVIEGVSGDEARARMLDVFGREWAFQYDAHDWFRDGVSVADRWGLQKIE